MPACEISPADRREQVRRVGNDLVRHYGKKKHYSVEEVKEANRRQAIEIDFGCWSHAVFNTHADFDAYHASIGEVCDYAGMKGRMLEAVSTPSTEAVSAAAGDAANWIDVDLSWLEFPDIDWSIFDFIDF